MTNNSVTIKASTLILETDRPILESADKLIENFFNMIDSIARIE